MDLIPAGIAEENMVKVLREKYDRKRQPGVFFFFFFWGGVENTVMMRRTMMGTFFVHDVFVMIVKG